MSCQKDLQSLSNNIKYSSEKHIEGYNRCMIYGVKDVKYNKSYNVCSAKCLQKNLEKYQPCYWKRGYADKKVTIFCRDDL